MEWDRWGAGFIKPPPLQIYTTYQPHPVLRDGRTTRAMSCVHQLGQEGPQQRVRGLPEQAAGTHAGLRGRVALPPGAYLSCGTAGSAVS